jgi:hypothetical protein
MWFCSLFMRFSLGNHFEFLFPVLSNLVLFFLYNHLLLEYVLAKLLLTPNEDRLCLEESITLLRFTRANPIEEGQAKFVSKQKNII